MRKLVLVSSEPFMFEIIVTLTIQYPGGVSWINSDVNNLMTVLSLSNTLPDGMI